MDKLFKVPSLPMDKKRKLPDNPTAETLKRMRIESATSPDTSPATGTTRNGDSDVSSNGKPRGVTVEDVDEEEHSPSAFAPGGDADYFIEEDEEGRFFGGGLTEEQKAILNIFDGTRDEDTQDDPSDLTITNVRKLLLRFERAVNKNQDQRSKYPNDPSKFIDSEADLDSAIKSLLPLAQVPSVVYPEIMRSGTATALIGLLSHENADIVIDVVEVIHELTDEDVGNEGEDEDEDGRDQALKWLIEGFLGHSLLELLVQNLARLNEAEDSDRQGIFHIIGIFENTLGFNPTLSTRLMTDTTILQWLLERISAKAHDENRGYAAEVLSILLQDNRDNRLALGAKGGIETLLKVLSQFRKRDPVDADETEFMENLFDILCSALIEPEMKKSFSKEEGVDLMLIMMKEKLQSRSRAIKALDHALSGPAGTPNCETFVEAFGLKPLFLTFMGKSKKQRSSVAGTPGSEDTFHVLGIISSLFSNLPSDSPARVRLLTKFVEENYEKVDRLIEIRENAETRLKSAEKEIEQERKHLVADGVIVGADEEDTWYLRKLDSGLFTLQIVDSIVGWICMEDDGIREHVSMMLCRKDKSLKDVVNVLKVYLENMDDGDTRSFADGTEGAAPSQKEILQGLITFLEEC